MLRVSSINFNQTSKSNKNSNYQQNPKFKMNSTQMNDTVSFGMAKRLAKPIAKNVQTIMGHDFIPNVQFRTWYTNAKPLTLKQANKIASEINTQAQNMTKELTSYKPEHLKQWVKRVLETKHSNAKVIVSNSEGFSESRQYGENEAYLDHLYAKSKKHGFLSLNKLSSESPNSEYVDFTDKRVGIEMKEYLINVFQNKNKNISVEIEGKKHLIQSSNYGINILPLEEM